MRNLFKFLFLGSFACSDGPKPTAVQAQTPPPQDFHSLSAVDINGQPFPLAGLKGSKVMVVNTASECGYTPQYKQLQALYARFKDKGFTIIGFPSNDFGGQEPGSDAEIATFCEKNYGVSFPMMSKVSTKGDTMHPVYQWLTRKDRNGAMDSQVKWNFQKYLINADGSLHSVLPSATDPLSTEVTDWIEGRK
jgi:glutathione peroxidase